MIRGCVIGLDNGSRGRAEGPKAPSPGQHPGYKSNQQGVL